MKKYAPKKKFMKLAIEQAKKAAKSGEYAIGAVVIKNDKLIAKGEQRGSRDKDASSHAEIIAMRKASKKLKNNYLKECVLYSTHEPCCMCAGMAVWNKLKGIVFGTNIKDIESYWQKRGANTKLIPCKEILRRYNSRAFIIGNFMRKECKKLNEINPK